MRYSIGTQILWVEPDSFCPPDNKPVITIEVSQFYYSTLHPPDAINEDRTIGGFIIIKRKTRCGKFLGWTCRWVTRVFRT